MTVHNCVTQYSTETVLIILPVIVQTIIVTWMLSTGGKGTIDRQTVNICIIMWRFCVSVYKLVH